MSNLHTLATESVSDLADATTSVATSALYVCAGVLAAAAICVWAGAMLLRRRQPCDGDRRWRTTVENVVTVWLALRLAVVAALLAVMAVTLPSLTAGSWPAPICGCTVSSTWMFS